MQIGAIIPDLVAVNFADVPATTQPALTFRQAFVLARLRTRNRFRSATLAEACHMDESALLAVIAVLQRAGLATLNASGSFSASQTATDDSIRVTAVEAKLCRWNEAVEQALSYRTFANRVVIALDATHGTPERALSTCSDQGVGIWLVHESGIEHVLPPADDYVLSAEREFILASALAGQGPWKRTWS